MVPGWKRYRASGSGMKSKAGVADIDTSPTRLARWSPACRHLHSNPTRSASQLGITRCAHPHRRTQYGLSTPRKAYPRADGIKLSGPLIDPPHVKSDGAQMFQQLLTHPPAGRVRSIDSALRAHLPGGKQRVVPQVGADVGDDHSRLQCGLEELQLEGLVAPPQHIPQVLPVDGRGTGQPDGVNGDRDVTLSTQLLEPRPEEAQGRKRRGHNGLAGATGFEPATSSVTGRCAKPGYTTPPRSAETHKSSERTCGADHSRQKALYPGRSIPVQPGQTLHEAGDGRVIQFLVALRPQCAQDLVHQSGGQQRRTGGLARGQGDGQILVMQADLEYRREIAVEHPLTVQLQDTALRKSPEERRAHAGGVDTRLAR